jgi:putative addiction module CopG family antidote
MHLELALSDEALAAINECVASGEFASPSAVVEAALALLARVEAQERERIRTALAEGEEDARQDASRKLTQRASRRSVRGWPRSAASDSCLRDPTHC